MLGDLLTRLLVILLGYAYPAFECYKTVEKNRIEIEQLRFWCQYWIIVAILTVTERFGDVFISWLPMYGEIKLAFFIYLWHPKTQGTSYVYQTFLKPYVAKHETDIDRSILELRARAWDLFIFYWQNFAKYGQTTFFQILQYLAAQSSRINHNDQKATPQSSSGPDPTPAPAAPAAPVPVGTASMNLPSKKQSPSSSMKMNRSIVQETKVDTVKEQTPKSEAIVTETTTMVAKEEPNTKQENSAPTIPQESNMDETLRSALTRLRRSNSRPQQ